MNAPVGSTRRTDTISTIDVKGQRLRVAIRPGRESTPDDPPLLLINGIGVSLEVFQPFIDELDPDIEVIRFDVPGVGGSPRSIFPYCFSTLAYLITQMLNKFDYKQVDVLGLSWGGGLAQQFAFQYPQRCRRLILVSTSTGSLAFPGRPSVLAKLATPRCYQDTPYITEIAQDIYGGDLQSNPEFVHHLARAIYAGEPLSYFYQLMAAAGWTSLPWLKLLRQPTLILAGDDDPIVPDINARIMHQLIPNSKLYIYRGGHLGLLTHASELTTLIKEFLSCEMAHNTR